MKQGKKAIDLTQGRPLVQLARFAVPLILGTLFQQFYTFTDTVIVGRCLGVDALAAVGVNASLHFLTLGFVQGSCIGFGIPAAQSFGARDKRRLHRYLWNGVWLCAALSVALAAGMTALARPLLRLVHTPTDILDMAAAYIRVLFLGIPASMLYNYTASILRAVGDARHPFYFLVFSCFLNIGLDWLFIVPGGMGVGGAALATVLSQLASGLLGAWWLLARTAGIEICRGDMAPSLHHLGRLCAVGLPMGLEHSVTAVGSVVMQNAINTLGSAAVAAQTAGEKIRQVFTSPMESMGMAMATYTGQNYGAGRLDRVRRGIRDGLLIQGAYCLAAWTGLFLLKGGLARLVLGADSGAVYAMAVQYITVVSTQFVLHGALMILRNTLQGLGHSGLALLSGACELVGRSVGGWLAIRFFGYTAICYASGLAWGLALCYCAVTAALVLRRLRLGAAGLSGKI